MAIAWKLYSLSQANEIVLWEGEFWALENANLVTQEGMSNRFEGGFQLWSWQQDQVTVI
jgi:hypothetical protein